MSQYYAKTCQYLSLSNSTIDKKITHNPNKYNAIYREPKDDYANHKTVPIITKLLLIC